MTLERLRQKSADGTPVLWPGMRTYGIVTRVARDGSWADMVWWQGPARLGSPPPGYPCWSKRTALGQLDDWEDA